jgi:hypothetical protein
MNRLLRTLSAGVLLLAAGCAFNAEEQEQSLTWTRDLAGTTSVSLSTFAFATGAVEVEGIEAESLAVTCDMRRMVAGGDWYNDVDLRASRSDEAVELSLVVEGDQWTTLTVDRTALRLGNDIALDLGTVEKDVSVSGYRGMVTAASRAGDITVSTAAGADLETGDGDVGVTLEGDSLDPRLESAFESLDIASGSGDIAVRVPQGMRVRLALEAGRGQTITIDGNEMDETSYSGSLNGGAADRTITCETGGSIAIVQVAAP